LAKSYEAIRNEIYNLPIEVRTKLPRFTCLDDLLLWKQDGQRVIALDMALTCLYQLSVFIRYGLYLALVLHLEGLRLTVPVI
jgi:hypothetical protein